MPKKPRAQAIYDKDNQRRIKQCAGCSQYYAIRIGSDYCDKCTKRLTEPDWEGECSVCGESPIVPATGMCGPCTFGEADTMGGNW